MHINSSQRDLKQTNREYNEQLSIVQQQNQSKVTFISKQLDSLNDIQPDFDDEDFPKNSKFHVPKRKIKYQNDYKRENSDLSSQSKTYSKSEREVNNSSIQKANAQKQGLGGSPQISKRVTYKIQQEDDNIINGQQYNNQKSYSSGSNGGNQNGVYINSPNGGKQNQNQNIKDVKKQPSMQSKSSTDRQISRKSFFGNKGFESSCNVNGKKRKVRIFGPFDQKQWQELKKVVLIFTFVVSFISKITFKTKGKIALRKLTIQQVTAIADKSYLYIRGEHFDGQDVQKEYVSDNTILDEDKFNKKTDFCFLRCINFIGSILSKLFPMIYPNGYFKILTDCWSSYWVVFRMYFTSIRLFFFITNIAGSINIIKLYTIIIINLSFFIDMLLSLNTAYYENGIIVRNRKKIAYNYFKTTFLSDILSQIPLFFSYFVNEDSSRPLITISFILEFLIFLKIFSLKKTFQRLERVITETESGAQWWPMVRLIVNVFLLAHIVGLFYFGLARIQIEVFGEQKSWLQIQNLEGETWFIQYLWSIYWAFGTMVANISRDPETQTEIIFSLIMIVLMTGTFGYALNTIGMILSDIEKNTKKYTLEKQMINRFMRSHQIPEFLRERVDLYLEQLQQLEKQRNQQEEELILGRMSEQLKREILQSVNQKNIKKFDALLKNFSEDSRLEMLLVIKEELFSPGDIIFTQNVAMKDNERIKDDKSIYYIQNGTVDIYYENEHGNKKSIVSKLQQGQLFGQTEFITGNERAVSAKSNTSVSVLKIDRSDFYNIVKKISDDYQQLRMMCDEIQQYKSCEQYEIECYLCQQLGHQAKDCPSVHLNINVKQLIYDYNHYDIQVNRTEINRQLIRSHHSLQDIEYIVEAVNEILDEEIEDDDLKQQIKAMQQLSINYENMNNIDNGNNQNDQKIRRSSSANKQSLENYHNLQKLHKNSFLELQNIDEQQEISEDQQSSSQASGLKVPQNQNNNLQTSPRVSTSNSQLHDTTPDQNHLQVNNQIDEFNLNNTQISQNSTIQRSGNKRGSSLIKNQEKQQHQQSQQQQQPQIKQPQRRQSQRGDFLREQFAQQKSVSKGIFERKIQQSQHFDLLNPKNIQVSKQIQNSNSSNSNNNNNNNKIIQQLLNMLIKEQNNNPNLLNQNANNQNENSNKLQISQNYRNKTIDIDMEDFDKLCNWSVYWTKHNYQQIKKQEKIKSLFKNPEDEEEELVKDSQSMHSSFFKSHCHHQQTGTTQAFTKQQNYSSKAQLNGNERQTEFNNQDLGQSMLSLEHSQNLNFNNIQMPNKEQYRGPLQHTTSISPVKQKKMTLQNFSKRQSDKTLNFSSNGSILKNNMTGIQIQNPQ